MMYNIGMNFFFTLRQAIRIYVSQKENWKKSSQGQGAITGGEIVGGFITCVSLQTNAYMLHVTSGRVWIKGESKDQW
jgi:hypothetical protein